MYYTARIIEIREVIEYYYCYISGCTTVEALEAATLHPAQLLGIESHKGTLDYNSAADFIFLTDDLKVQISVVAVGPINEKDFVSDFNFI